MGHPLAQLCKRLKTLWWWSAVRKLDEQRQLPLASDERILGPEGALPPGVWAVGARVLYSGEPCVLLEHGAIRERDGAVLTLGDTTASAQLDLSCGSLDHGARALLHLLLPDTPQPLTAPMWECDGKGVWWLPDYGCSIGELHDDPRQALAIALEVARA